MNLCPPPIKIPMPTEIDRSWYENLLAKRRAKEEQDALLGEYQECRHYPGSPHPFRVCRVNECAWARSHAGTSHLRGPDLPTPKYPRVNYDEMYRREYARRYNVSPAYERPGRKPSRSRSPSPNRIRK